MTTTEDAVRSHPLTVERRVDAFIIQSVTADAALIDIGGSEPHPGDVRILVEIVDIGGNTHAFELTVEAIPSIVRQLDDAGRAAVALRSMHE